MTNEQAIERIAEKLKTARRNATGAINGNVRHGYYQSLKNTFKRNGAEHNEACTMAGRVMQELLKPYP